MKGIEINVLRVVFVYLLLIIMYSGLNVAVKGYNSPITYGDIIIYFFFFVAVLGLELGMLQKKIEETSQN